MNDRRDYVLAHTPRQIVEEKGYTFANSIFHEYFSKYDDDDLIEEFNYVDYIDRLPSDSYFDNYYQKNYRDNQYGLTPEDIKLAFISVVSVLYAQDIRNEKRKQLRA